MNEYPIQRIAVIGAGLMGHGIALDFAVAGYDIRLHDLTADALARAQENIAEALQRLEQLGLITAEQRSRAPERIRGSVNLPDVVADVDFVIESATENLEVKRRIFAELDRLCPARTILASNSSSLMPSSYVSATNRSARVLGVHYFNPPYLLPCVEVVAGPGTAEATLQTVRELLLRLGKQVATIRKEVPGFIANRLQAALFREAFSLVERGIATPDDIDAAVQYGIGRRFATAGPFEVFDLAGLDTVLAAGRNLMADLESSPAVSPRLEEKVARGELGVKTGKGFYAWTPDSARALQGRIASGLARLAESAWSSTGNQR